MILRLRCVPFAFGDQKFDFRPLRMKPEDTEVTVQVRVLQSGAQPVEVRQIYLLETCSGCTPSLPKR